MHPLQQVTKPVLHPRAHIANNSHLHAALPIAVAVPTLHFSHHSSAFTSTKDKQTAPGKLSEASPQSLSSNGGWLMVLPILETYFASSFGHGSLFSINKDSQVPGALRAGQKNNERKSLLFLLCFSQRPGATAKDQRRNKGSTLTAHS